jgi:hypothetical protein
VVALVNAVGLNIVDIDRPLQKVLAAVSAAVLVLILYIIARTWFAPRTSVFISTFGLFGTIIGATVGSAPWSLNYELVFEGLCAIYLVRLDRQRQEPFPAWLLGLFLFLAFLSRPTAAPFILAVLLYLLVRSRQAFVRAAAVSAVLLIGFMVWSHADFHHWLPPYYAPGRLDFAIIPKALWAAIASPSRNIFIWAPFTVLLPFLLWRFGPPSPLILVFLFTAAMTLLSGLAFECWWFGHSFGPRGLTDSVFPMLLAVIILCGELATQEDRPRWLSAPAGLLGALVLGSLINLQGLLNPWVYEWTVYPDVDTYPTAIIFDWRYPQFLATRNTVYKKYIAQSTELGFVRNQMVPVHETVLSVSADGRQRETSYRFNLDWPIAHSASLKLVAITMGAPTVNISFNDNPVGTLKDRAIFSTRPIIDPDKFVQGSNELKFLSSSPNGGRFAVLVYFVLRFGT